MAEASTNSTQARVGFQRNASAALRRLLSRLHGQAGVAGSGLEAQQAAVAEYIAANPGKLVAEYAETKSGRNNRRPKIAEALQVCRIFGAALLIARLDRLSRNVAMIAQLIESKVDFVAIDFPHATRLTLHILAAIAEHESRLISDRVKSARAAARARGETWRSGKPEPHVSTRKPSDERAPAPCPIAGAHQRSRASGVESDRRRNVLRDHRRRIQPARRKAGAARAVARKFDWQPRARQRRCVCRDGRNPAAEPTRIAPNEDARPPQASRAVAARFEGAGQGLQRDGARTQSRRLRLAAGQALGKRIDLEILETGDSHFKSA